VRHLYSYAFTYGYP
jgi:hypothetical protein